jgi:hypothetical protein
LADEPKSIFGAVHTIDAAYEYAAQEQEKHASHGVDAAASVARHDVTKARKNPP